jgi:hypothetical protein
MEHGGRKKERSKLGNIGKYLTWSSKKKSEKHGEEQRKTNN